MQQGSVVNELRPDETVTAMNNENRSKTRKRGGNNRKQQSREMEKERQGSMGGREGRLKTKHT